MGEKLVKTIPPIEETFRFLEAKIVRRISNGLMLKIVNSQKNQDGFIFNADIKSELQGRLNTNNIIGTTINVRFAYQPTTENRNSVYTQRNYYPQDTELELEIIDENEKYILAIAEDGVEYKLAKAAWETGPKYSKQEIGKKVKCRVYKVMWGNSYFDRINIPNPYFIEIAEWVKDSEIVTITFNEWVNYADTDVKLKLRSDYYNQNANYIFSYLTILEELIHETIFRYNIKAAISFLETVIQIDKKILTCGFLLTQKQSLRDETKDTIEGKLIKYNHWIENLYKIGNLGIDKIFENSIAIIEKEHMINGVIHDQMYLITFILDHFPIDDTKNNYLENLVNLLLKNNMIFIEENAFPSFRWALNNRRKFIRKKLFSSLKFQSLEIFEHNQTLAHFIFLKNIDYQCCQHFKDLIQAFLEKASLLYYKALYTKDKIIKQQLIIKSIELLKDLNITRKDFIDSEQYSVWSTNMNNIMARNFEVMYSLSENQEESIHYLVKARDYYILAKAKRGYLIEYYIQYLSVINLIKKTNVQEIEGLISNIYLIHQRILEDLKYSNIFPILNYFDLFYGILMSFGKIEQKYIDYLYSLIYDQSEEPKGLPCISKLARIILSNNLLINLLNDKYIFWIKIQEFLDQGEFTLPMEEVIVDEDDEQYDSHPVFVEENHKIEFKGSIALHLDKYFHTGEVELSEIVRKSFLKTIVGMLNGGGGEIYIGVLELEKYSNLNKLVYLKDFNPLIYKNKIILGFDKEIESYNKSVDDHIRHISSVLRKRIDPDVMQNILIESQVIKDKNIYRISISKGEKVDGYYLDKTEFYVRENNETLLYDNQKTVAFLMRKIRSKEL